MTYKELNKSPNKIMIIRNDVLGDVVLTLPLINAIKSKWENAHISVVAQDYTLPILDGHPSVDSVIIDYKKSINPSGIKLFYKTVKELKEKNIDMIFFPKMDPFYIWAAWLANIPVRVGDKHQFLLSPLLTTKVPIIWEDITKHEVEQQLKLISPFSNDKNVSFELNSDQSITSEIQEKISSKHPISNKFICIHPSYGEGNRGWYTDRYISLIDQIHKELDYQVILIGSEREKEINDCIELKCNIKPINLTNQTTLKELVSLINLSDCVVGTETGPVHIASALSIPIISISPTKFIKSFRWGPFNTNHVVITKNDKCPLVCNTYKNNCEENFCIQDIHISDVFYSISHIINLKTKFPLNQKQYWFKTIARMAYHVDALDDQVIETLNYIQTMLKHFQCECIITTSNKSIINRLQEIGFSFVFYSASIRMLNWVTFFRVNDITIWHIINSNQSNILQTILSHWSGLAVYLRPFVIRDQIERCETISEFINSYLDRFEKL